MVDISYQSVRCLAQLKEIQYENVFIAGTKIEANANCYTFVWKKMIMKNEEQMYFQIQTLIAEINQMERKDFSVSSKTLLYDMNQISEWLDTEMDRDALSSATAFKVVSRKCSITLWLWRQS